MSCDNRPTVPSRIGRPSLHKSHSAPGTIEETVVLPTRKEEQPPTMTDYLKIVKHKCKMGFDTVHQELRNFVHIRVHSQREKTGETDGKKCHHKSKDGSRPTIVRADAPEEKTADKETPSKLKKSESLSHGPSPLLRSISAPTPNSSFVKDRRSLAVGYTPSKQTGVLKCEMTRHTSIREESYYEPVEYSKSNETEHALHSKVPNGETLGMKHTSEDAKIFFGLSTNALCDLLSRCGLSKFRKVCEAECLDGVFLETVYEKELKEDPFALSNFQIAKLHRVIQGWIPNA